MTNINAAIIDYGVGNIRSVIRVIEAVELETFKNITVTVTDAPTEILKADLIVLPGVGSFQSAAAQVSPYANELCASIKAGKPTVGICLGMQLLFQRSEEGQGAGLGVFDGNVTGLTSKRIPHMGWNEIYEPNGTPSEVPFAYFAHSFACRPEDISLVSGLTRYQGDEFVSVIETDSLLATQFHPEKSDVAGIGLLHSFLRGAFN